MINTDNDSGELMLFKPDSGYKQLIVIINSINLFEYEQGIFHDRTNGNTA